MEKLYKQLIALVEMENTPFFFSEQTNDIIKYRIFNYRFVDTDYWDLPGAYNARGIMFEVDDDGNYVRLASRTMPKFFNLGEHPKLNYSEPEIVMEKADGSLMSTYRNYGELYLKSKGSLGSDHCLAAMDYLDVNPTFKDWLLELDEDGYTVNLEWVSPDPKFRIVLHYCEPKLIVLNAINRTTGKYLDQNDLVEMTNRLCLPCVKIHKPSVLNVLDNEIGIEGYVVIDKLGQWYKRKCNWYLERHRAKDFINQPRAFIELVMKEEADDIFSLLNDQPIVLAEMKELEHKVNSYANTLIQNVSSYYDNNKDMSRKDYAIKGKEDLDSFEFSLAMMYYSGKEPNWNEFLLKSIKKIDWGFSTEDKEKE